MYVFPAFNTLCHKRRKNAPESIPMLLFLWLDICLRLLYVRAMDTTKNKRTLMMKKQQKPKVSVIIPVYNVEKYLPQCLESVIKQTLPEIEIICVDDGSTDRSLEILNKYAKKDKRIKVLTQTNKSAGAARNAGIAAAQGEFLSFLDSDDFFELTMLEEMYHKAVTDDSDIVVCGYTKYDQAAGKDVTQRHLDEAVLRNSPIRPEEYSDKLFFHCFPNPWSKLIRHKLFTKYHLRFEELKKCNDLTCIYMALATARAISFIDRLFIHYRFNTGAQTSTDRFGKNEYFIHAVAALEKGMHKLGLYDKFYNKMFFSLAESLRWETQGNINLLRDLAKQKLSERLYRDFYETKLYRQIQESDLIKYSQIVKFLFFLPVYGWVEKGGKKVWKVLGIPVLKRRKMAKDDSVKYYICGLPFIKVNNKQE